MSMIGCFCALRDEDIEAIVAQPKRIKKLWEAPTVQPKAPSFLARLFGVKTTRPIPEQEDPWKPSETAEEFDVDKAWQGIHFLLTGTAWEGDGPLAFILHGGREIDEDLGYGPPHGFTSGEVKGIARALDGLKVEELCEKAEPAKFTENEIYPEIWGKEPREACIGYVAENLTSLREFVRKVAESNRGLIVYLG